MTTRYLILDLEATCWEPGQERGRQGEIIEIGAVIVDANLDPCGESQTFVKPTENPTLSEFCTKLTSIRQSDVDSAPILREALSLLVADVERQAARPIHELEFLSWGFYDRKQFERELSRKEIPYPFGPHRSLKHEFAERRDIKPCGMDEALRMLKLSLVGTHHRGIDDARNIARIFKAEWAGAGK